MARDARDDCTENKPGATAHNNNNNNNNEGDLPITSDGSDDRMAGQARAWRGGEGKEAVDDDEKGTVRSGDGSEGIGTIKRGSSDEIRVETDDMAAHATPADAETGRDAAAAGGYRVYKRRWFGLLQLTLLNVIVSWDVSAFYHLSSPLCL